eukprot:373325-Prymnesium_polylepis.4
MGHEPPELVHLWLAAVAERVELDIGDWVGCELLDRTARLNVGGLRGAAEEQADKRAQLHHQHRRLARRCRGAS